MANAKVEHCELLLRAAILVLMFVSRFYPATCNEVVNWKRNEVLIKCGTRSACDGIMLVIIQAD